MIFFLLSSCGRLERHRENRERSFSLFENFEAPRSEIRHDGLRRGSDSDDSNFDVESIIEDVEKCDSMSLSMRKSPFRFDLM